MQVQFPPDVVLDTVGGETQAAIARQAGVDFVTFKAAATIEARSLTAARIGLFQRYRGGNMDEGWTRLMFEQFDVPFTTVRDAELKAGGLETKFDVIVLPADSISAMTGEESPGGGRGRSSASICPCATWWLACRRRTSGRPAPRSA